MCQHIDTKCFGVRGTTCNNFCSSTSESSDLRWQSVELTHDVAMVIVPLPLVDDRQISQGSPHMLQMRYSNIDECILRSEGSATTIDCVNRQAAAVTWPSHQPSEGQTCQRTELNPIGGDRALFGICGGVRVLPSVVPATTGLSSSSSCCCSTAI